MTTYLSSYEYQSDFNNGYTLTGVSASAGNMIIVACQGRENAGVFGFATPSWNGETFTPVSELTVGSTGLHIYKLIAASSGSFNIAALVDEFAGSGYGGITAVAIVASGSFDGSSVDGLVASYWDTGTYASPSQNVANAVSGDLIVSILAAPKQNNGGIDVATTYTSNGTIRAQAETAATRVGDLYIATHTGTGTVATTYTRSGSDEPVWRMASFRITEVGGGSGVTIDDAPSDIRVTESRTIRVTAPTTAMTTGNTDIFIDADTNAPITPSLVTTVSGLQVDIDFTVPDEYAGLPYDDTGYVIIVSTADGDATSAAVPYLPVTGNGDVILTDVSDTDIESSPALEVPDQIEWTNAAVITIDDEGKVTSTEESATFEFRVWDHNDSTWGDWAEVVFGSGGDIAPDTPSSIISAGLTSLGLTIGV